LNYINKNHNTQICGLKPNFFIYLSNYDMIGKKSILII